MSEETELKANTGGVERRERSSIEFPYMSLDEAMSVAKGVHETTGSGWCQMDQLAAALGLSMASSGFRVRMGTAKMFGLIESERGTQAVRLTDLGHRVVDPAQERGAKIQAFLNVPLYNKLVDLHRGKTLPPPAALERVMAELGVARKQTDRARQTFERSALGAGFFDFGRDKLVAPAVNASVSGVKREEDRHRDVKASNVVREGMGGDGDGFTGDPLIDALIRKLPRAGDQWSPAERSTWMTLIKMAFDLAYGIDSTVSS